MPLDICFAKSAAKELRKIPKESQQRIVNALKGLQDDPRPSGVEKIRGYPAFLRIRIGDFRVIYHVLDDVALIVLVVRDRKDAYDRKVMRTLSSKLESAEADNVVVLRRASKPN